MYTWALRTHLGFDKTHEFEFMLLRALVAGKLYKLMIPTRERERDLGTPQSTYTLGI